MDDVIENKSLVRLKGMGNSLCVTLNPTDPIDYLQDELTRLFNEFKDLSEKQKVILDFGDAGAHEDTYDNLKQFILDSFGVNQVTRPPEKKRKVRKRPETPRQKDMERSWQQYQSEVLMLAGRVRSGQKVTADRHLVILGDVNPGAEVIAGGDIIVMGSLCGMAVSGYPDNEAAIILALDFRPVQVQIGGVVAAGLPLTPRKTPEFAHVENNAIVVEDYVEVNPFGRLPWPEAR